MDLWLALFLLVMGVVGATVRPWGMPGWLGPVLAAAIDLVTGISAPGGAERSLQPLLQPVAFLIAAVPLAVLLDELGLFSAAASRLAAKGHGPAALWVLAAAVTTLLNLDAAVVLLTPLYVRLATKRGWPPLVLAVQPVILACLASSALPVSNLTNLIVLSWAAPPTAAYLVHLALPSAAACTVAWFAYSRATSGRLGTARDERPQASDDARPASLPAAAGPGGAPAGAAGWPVIASLVVLALVVVGFSAGPLAGVSPWVVALGADCVLALVLVGSRRGPAGKAVPWRSVPVGTAVLVLALGVLTTAAAARLDVGSFFRGDDLAELARDTGVAALAANVVNNLPTLLIALPKLGHRPTAALWAFLLGVNVGPVLLVTGSLASLLWISTVRRLGVSVRARDFTWFGLRVGLPGACTAVVVALAQRAVGLH